MKAFVSYVTDGKDFDNTFLDVDHFPQDVADIVTMENRIIVEKYGVYKPISVRIMNFIVIP